MKPIKGFTMLWLTPGHIAADGWLGWMLEKPDPEKTDEQRQHGAPELSTYRLRLRKSIRTKRLKFLEREKDVKLSAQYEKRGLSFSGRDWVALHDNFTYEHYRRRRAAQSFRLINFT
ncbi:hypothetical protein WN982_10780 [Paraburkholderia sp. IMGN_8]|uniref:hypothetical protein n=1 Tax=Paraburkholderia sp. IMGN_8 TaxID=3136564 RepID=UPI00310155B0